MSRPRGSGSGAMHQAHPEPEPEPEKIFQVELPGTLMLGAIPGALTGPPAVQQATGAAPLSRLAAKKRGLTLGGGLDLVASIPNQMTAAGRASSRSLSGKRPPRSGDSNGSSSAGSKLSARKQQLNLDFASPPDTLGSSQDASFEIAQSPGGTPAWVSLSHGIRLTTEGEVGCAVALRVCLLVPHLMPKRQAC